MSKNLVIAVLEDYCQLQLDGKVDRAGRYSVSDVSAAINELTEDRILVLAKGQHKASDVYVVQAGRHNYTIFVSYTTTFVIQQCTFCVDTRVCLNKVSEQVSKSLLDKYANIVKQLAEFISQGASK